MSQQPNPTYVLIRGHIVMIIVFVYLLAVGTEMIDDALKNVERISSWPVQALNIGLFLLVLVICWLYLKTTRTDLQKLQKISEDERKEYVANLKSLVGDMGKIIERNNIIFERIDKRLERIEMRSTSE